MNTTERKPVDVLAVLDKCAIYVEVESEYGDEFSEARAAVAELIEADKRLQAIRANGCSHDEWEAAIKAHDAALARVGGAA